MSRPGTRISRFYEKIEQSEGGRSGHYDKVVRDAEAKWRRIVADIGDQTTALDRTIESLSHVLGHRARLFDKLNLYKTLIADGIGKADGSLTDHEALLILAGWSTEHRVLSGEEEE
jgi:hypothetical protein